MSVSEVSKENTCMWSYTQVHALSYTTQCTYVHIQVHHTVICHHNYNAHVTYPEIFPARQMQPLAKIFPLSFTIFESCSIVKRHFFICLLTVSSTYVNSMTKQVLLILLPMRNERQHSIRWHSRGLAPGSSKVMKTSECSSLLSKMCSTCIQPLHAISYNLSHF